MASDDRSTTSPAAFSATDIRRRMSQRETEKAAAEMARMRAEEEKQKALLEEFHKPPARTAEQLQALVMQLVNQAAERGEHEVQVYRFPSALCTDGGRAINNFEASWDATLDGLAKLAHEAWRDHLRPLGFGLQARVLEYPGGMPGDIGLFLTW
jgi:hypothetical protein